MASIERKSKPNLGRKNTFQTMLDLEQKNKVNRMRVSPTLPTPHTSTPSGPPPRSILRQQAPAPLQLIGRAMTTPDISLSMPPFMPARNDNLKKHAVRFGGGVAPQEGEISENGSDISSICQSPGWEDYNTNKQKKAKEEQKERRRRERERDRRGASPQARQVRESESLNSQSMNRLSKNPPTNKRLTKMAITSERSASAPAIPNAPDKVKLAAKEEKKTAPEKVRRGSLDIGLKGFISATHAIPVPWKSSQNLPSSATPNHEAPSRKSFSRAPGSFADEGFIGGLKLEQRIIRDQKIEGRDKVQEQSHNEKGSKPRMAGTVPSNKSVTESAHPPISIYEESKRAPQQWEAVYDEAAASARGFDSPSQPEGKSTSMMERNIRLSRRSQTPTPRNFSLDVGGSASPQQGSLDINPQHVRLSSPRNIKENSNQRTEPLPPTLPSLPVPALTNNQRTAPPPAALPTLPLPPPVKDRGRASERYYPPQARGRASYVRHQRQESESKAIDALQDEQQVSGASDGKKPKSRRSSFVAFVRSRSRGRNPSQDGTRDNSIGPSTKNASDDTSQFIKEEDVLKQLHLELSTKASEGATNQSRSSSKSGFKGLTHAAFAAFSRHSAGAPESPSSEKFATTMELPRSSSKAPTSKRASIDVATTNGSAMYKMDKSLPDVPSMPTVHGFAVSPILHDRSLDRKDKAGTKTLESSTPNFANGNNGRSNHSRSATDSSEGYTTVDEFSDVTTPMASRPSSQKDCLPAKPVLSSKAEAASKISVSHLTDSPNGTPAMSGASPVDEVGARDSWCRSAVELDLTEDEDQIKTPTEKRSIPEVALLHHDKPSPRVAQVPLKRPHIADLQRKASLTRSISTPEMQDLSFLPVLKHQALTRHPKGKDTASTGNKSKPTIKSPNLEAHSPTKALVLPSTSAIPTTKSEGSSPTSPQSSQYLQTARLALPRVPHPSKTAFPPGTSHSNGHDPIAKMFVICCQCKYFHDMPSKIYECMTRPDNVVTDNDLGVSGVISTSVKCPWCGHGMSTACCAGYAAVVYLQEKMH